MRDYAYLILMSQTVREVQSLVIQHKNLDAQQVFRNTFENILNRRVDIPEEIQSFQKTLQYARRKADYVIGELTYLLSSDMNLRIGKIKNYNNKILISSSSFNIGTNLKINLDGEKDKQDVESKKKPNIESIKNANKTLKS